MRISNLLLTSLLFCASCTEKQNHNGQTPLGEIGKKVFYQEDLRSVLPVGLSSADSTLFAEQYIRNWIEETLLYTKAKSNIPDNKEIEQMVENYRKALIMHTYQQQLIDQKLSSEMPHQQLTDFYEQNKSLFKIENPLVKGLFIKVPLTAPQINNVRKWYKSDTREAIDNLEKYSFQNAVKYEYFHDKWVPLVDVIDFVPLKDSNPEAYLRKNNHIELKDTAFYYFLHLTEFREVGELEPYELALPKVKEMLVNRQQIDFMKQVREDLYQQETEKNKIIYNY